MFKSYDSQYPFFFVRRFSLNANMMNKILRYAVSQFRTLIYSDEIEGWQQWQMASIVTSTIAHRIRVLNSNEMYEFAVRCRRQIKSQN